ncbi:MAG: M48 family metallopeptidase [Thermodesulfobacteriota bacterium]
MKKLVYNAYFYDGQSANKNKAKVLITSGGLSVDYDDNDSLLWVYGDIRQNEEVYSPSETHLINLKYPNQKLIVEEPDFLMVIKKFFPSLKFYEPPKLISLRRMAILGLVLLLILLPVFYFIFIPFFSETVAEKIPMSFEKKLSAPYLSLLVPDESICNDDKNYYKIDTILNSLTATIPESKYEFKLFIVKSDILNAFALPGGYVVIYSGLLEKTDRPEQLAGVLAHEIQHITKRHGTEALVRDYSLGFLISAITNDTKSMETTLGLAKYIGLMKYSRESETEADVEGIKMLKNANFDPKGMVEFFEILNKHGGDVPNSLEYISSHPQTRDRILNLRELSKGIEYKPVHLYSKKDWDEIKKVCNDESITKFSLWDLY